MTGIRCPRCGADTHVADTRAYDRGVRRRRHCTAVGCDGRVTTVEIAVPSRKIYDGRDLRLVQADALRKARALLDEQIQDGEEP
jgi:transcriptional regulator NrdR family protein